MQIKNEIFVQILFFPEKTCINQKNIVILQQKIKENKCNIFAGVCDEDTYVYIGLQPVPVFADGECGD